MDPKKEPDEEGALVSDVEMSQNEESEESDQAMNPASKKLLDTYEKYPEYLQITIKKPA